MSDEATAIHATHLSRHFGSVVAVDRVSFSIQSGEIFGFLGPNGAGKSTTIRMLCGILAPTSGSATVAGFDVGTDPERVKHAIGYMSQRFGLYGDLTVQENLEFYGRVYGLGPRLQGRLQDVMRLTGLEGWKDRVAMELSGGWKQRLALATAILHEPRIVFLDEPTAGIDPLSRRGLWEMFYQLAERGVTLFVTTHYMEEADRCNQIAFITKGRLLKIGQPAQLKAHASGNLFNVQCDPLMKASRVFGGLPGVSGVTVYGTSLHLRAEDPQRLPQRLQEAAAQHGMTLHSVQSIEASLEDVFAALEGDVDGPD